MEILRASINDIPQIAELNRQLKLNIRGFVWDKPHWIKKQVKRGNYFVIREEEETLAAICLNNGITASFFSLG
ncbi:MAG: hypothetical protein ABIB71_01275 [Candidatus Woesearchaeota archaeon]